MIRAYTVYTSYAVTTDLNAVDACGSRAQTGNPANKLAREHLVKAHCAVETSRRYSVNERHLAPKRICVPARM